MGVRFGKSDSLKEFTFWKTSTLWKNRLFRKSLFSAFFFNGAIAPISFPIGIFGLEKRDVSNFSSEMFVV